MESVAADSIRNARITGIVRSERGRLFNFIRSRVRLKEDAEDILHDVFHQLVGAGELMEPIEKITSWLFTVARNRITDWYRKKRPEAMPATGGGRDGTEEDSALLLENSLFDPADDPEQIYYRSVVWDAIAGALEELPGAQREVFTLHELEGKSFAEISAETGVGVPTLLSRKRYAVAYLRTRLRELYNEINQ